ncbi:MAG: hypothetical protein ACRDCE_10480 [Cetobacterium sp.]|uniref:hypothetical protein n=1 Tax=Cetobacterium sp. TaxID=2071632 RepID=UPI003EE6772A
MTTFFVIAIYLAVSFGLYVNFLKSPEDDTSDKVMFTVLAVPVIAWTLFKDAKAKYDQRKN